MAKKVLFINQEIDPYVAETHMSIMGRELPQKMQEAGFEIRTFMPNRKAPRRSPIPGIR